MGIRSAEGDLLGNGEGRALLSGLEELWCESSVCALSRAAECEYRTLPLPGLGIVLLLI